MTKFILNGGYIHKSSDGGKAFFEEMTRGINDKSIKVLICMFGLAKESWDYKLDNYADLFSRYGQDAELEVALPEIFSEQIRNSDIVFFHGSRPEDMMRILQDCGEWMETLGGKVVVGSSGGASLLSRYFGTGKSTSGAPRLGEGLGLLPIKFIPHWKSDHGQDLIIDWDSLFEKLKNYKEEMEIVTLRDGEFKVIEQ